MSTCEMCGRDEQLFKAIVEGSKINVCKSCSKFGKVIQVIKEIKRKDIAKESDTTEKKEPEITYIIIKEYPTLIKNKRESLNMGQEEFSKKINEKESLIHNIESGRFEPNIQLAKKIEKFLKIKLIEEYKEDNTPIAKGKSDAFTIGDFIKVKK